ncbi:FkbM family methyltransferase [Methanolobus sediminis]|uniref:FkbM family methyltransferase n=1 Tax=Methanolobus sediminis TaxID=3072978 RepID=A0AA51YKW2_9EURY|nr:FkbM family methyltransferase [Methanolobus sediminis]WMW24312.1 FkbM family methyltransferase [Methanolobus sediminis]
MPFSHNLPHYIRSYPSYSSNLGRIAKLISKKYNYLSVIDIGANIGDSVAIIKTEIDLPILCIEGNKRFFELCQKNTSSISNVSLENVYIGNKTETTSLKTKNVGGTSHIYKDNTMNTVSEINMKTLTDVLKEHPLYLKSKLIKIDTDGFDGIILRGAIDYISATKPIIFFEYDPFFLSKQNDDGISIFAMLRSLGYKVALIYDNYGFYMLSTYLTNLHLLEDLHNYISDRGGKYYYDICVFHSEDEDLYNNIRQSEIQFFKTH